MTTLTLGKYHFHGTNHRELTQLKAEIFHDQKYATDIPNPTPTILDVGAHVGLSALYFSQCYPQATIISVEPNPVLFKYLTQNLWENHLDRIEVHQLAVSTQVGESMLYYDQDPNTQWYSNSSLLPHSWTGQEENVSTTVKTVPLDYFLTKPIDLLKLDVEGVELSVLSAAQHLHLVKQIIVESHAQHSKYHQQLIELLTSRGFVLQTKPQLRKQLQVFHFIKSSSTRLS